MLDWISILINSLWVLGCALGLSALSRASYLAYLQHTRFRAQLERPGIQVALNLAGALVSLGMAGGSTRTWETILLICLAFVFMAQNLQFIRKRRAIHG